MLKGIKKVAAAMSLCGAFALSFVGCGTDELSALAPLAEASGLFGDSTAVDVNFEEHTLTLDSAVDSLVIGSLDVLGGSKYYLALDDDPVDPEIDWDNELNEGSVIYFKDTNEVRVVVMDDENRTLSVWTIKVPKIESSSSSDAESSAEESSENSSSSEAASSSEEGSSEDGSSAVKNDSFASENASSSAGAIAESSTANSSESKDAESSATDISSESKDAESSSAEASSESKNTESSSSETAIESSAVAEPESSSAEIPAEESSSSVAILAPEPESSSEAALESSSSEEVVTYVKLTDFVDGCRTVGKCSVSLEDSKIYVEMEYGSDLRNLSISPLESSLDLTRSKEMQFEYNGEVKTFNVVAGVQLPGADFDERVDSFWGTTSDAMATEGVGKYIVTIYMSSTANATFDNSWLTLETKTVTGTGWNIDGGWKMAGGFYYAGSFSAENAGELYMADPSSGNACVDGCPADISKYMSFGKPFNARPSSFEVKYSYYHSENTNDTYPQSSLIYVVLLSADNKIVAAGKISDDQTVTNVQKTVELKYGSDAGLSDALGVSGLQVGTGDEDVASIRVMAASSALAYIADGGTSSQMEKHFRGGEGSQLMLNYLKLNY